MANSNTNIIDNKKYKKQVEKRKLKEDRQKQLNNTIESHTLKYYSYFSLLINIFLAIVSFFTLLFTFGCAFHLKKISKNIDNNKIQSSSAFSVPQVSSYSVNDLTGTTWVLNSNLTMPNVNDYLLYSISFVSNSNNFDELLFYDYNDDGGVIVNSFRYNGLSDVDVYILNSYTTIGLSYKTIYITGGSDVTNSSLISWLQSNAVQQQSSIQLNAPVISVYTPNNGNVYIRWLTDPHATSYRIYRNNSWILGAPISSDGSYKLFPVPSNGGTLKVQAIGDGTNYTDSDYSNSITFPLEILSTPVISLVGSNQPNTFKWAVTDGGSRIYRNGSIYFGNTIFSDTIYNYYTITEIGNYQVQRVGDGLLFGDSGLSNTLTFSTLTLPSPTLSFNSSTLTLSWNIISDATSYEIYKNNTFVATTENTSYSLVTPFGGTYNVVAISSDGNYANSAFSNSIVYETAVLNGSYAFIGSSYYNYNNLPTDLTLNFAFTSNGYNFNSFVIDTNSQSIKYVNTDTLFNYTIFTYLYDVPNLYFSLKYVPQDTANYFFINVDNVEIDIDDYNDYFVHLFRVPTNIDYENLGYQNGLIETNQYTMANLLYAIGDTPIILLKSLLNFEFFGVNLFAICTFIITLLLVYAVFRFVKGGKDNDKK